MKTISIHIDKKEVFLEAQKLSEYIGAKLETTDTDQYERLMLTDDDLETLSRFFTEACHIAVTTIKDKVIASDFTDDGFDLTLEVSRMYDDAMTPTVKANLSSYIINYIFSSYLKTVIPERAEDYATQAQGHLDVAVSALFKRMRPRRPGREAL